MTVSPVSFYNRNKSLTGSLFHSSSDNSSVTFLCERVLNVVVRLGRVANYDQIKPS